MAGASPDDVCPGCGTTYRDFRTGFTFGCVSEMMWSPSEDAEQWRNRRRHGVLGYWKQLKQDLWGQHLRECLPPEPDDDIPW